ncbi:uncharacterized protein LOC143085162 isoform X2 [Mytilus galloprovincialis]|uniref:uncharacterized protein LOC143085162 isoform X2 n=1 Tax=Mytilus galloprovincialis TaxID=29158 RepID=UPI003F7BD8D2
MGRKGTSFITLSKIENILMFVIIWACILSIHYAYRKSGTDALNKISSTINTIPKSLEKETIHKDSNKKDILEDSDFLQPDLEAKVQKELEEIKKEQERELKKESIRKKEGEFYSTYKEDEVYKWFDERPKRTELLKDPSVQSSNQPKYFIKGENICKGKTDILFYIHSKNSNEKNRKAIRQTYAHPENFKKLTVRVVFILGKGANEEEKSKIIKESEAHKDIVQTDFEDNQRNLSYKVLTFLQWVVDFCSSPVPRYIVKVDDDFFVNPFMLVEEFISEVWEKENFVACHYKENSHVVRTKNSKWNIPESAYPIKDPDVFPKTCSGYTAIFPGDLVPVLRSISVDTPFIPVDDAYLFSVMFEKLDNPQYKQILEGMTLNKDMGLQDYSGNKRLQYMSVSAWGDITEMMNILWKGTMKHLTTLVKQFINEKRLPK